MIAIHLRGQATFVTALLRQPSGDSRDFFLCGRATRPSNISWVCVTDLTQIHYKGLWDVWLTNVQSSSEGEQVIKPGLGTTCRAGDSICRCCVPFDLMLLDIIVFFY